MEYTKITKRERKRLSEAGRLFFTRHYDVPNDKIDEFAEQILSSQHGEHIQGVVKQSIEQTVNIMLPTSHNIQLLFIFDDRAHVQELKGDVQLMGIYSQYNYYPDGKQGHSEPIIREKGDLAHTLR